MFESWVMPDLHTAMGGIKWIFPGEVRASLYKETYPAVNFPKEGTRYPDRVVTENIGTFGKTNH